MDKYMVFILLQDAMRAKILITKIPEEQHLFAASTGLSSDELYF